MVLTIAEPAKVTRLIARALAIATIACTSSATGWTVFQMLTHAAVALQLSTCRAVDASSAKAFLVTCLSTKLVSADATKKRRSLVWKRQFVVLVIYKNGRATFEAFPLLDGSRKCRIRARQIENGRPISRLLGNGVHSILRKVGEFRRHGGETSDTV